MDAQFNPVLPERWKVSWDGMEAEREQLREAAHRVRSADAECRKHYPSSVATGLICEAVREPALAATPLVATAGDAVTALYTLHRDLIWQRGLDFDLVRREWAPILNPRPSELARCEALVARAVKREAKRRRTDEAHTPRKRRRKE